MSGVLRLSNSVTGRSTINASASTDETYTLPALGGTLVARGANSELIFPPGTEALPGLHVQGDVNTGLYAPAANTLGISTGGNERLRIDSSGKVGIGTDNPSGKLELKANGTSQIIQTWRADLGTNDRTMTLTGPTVDGVADYFRFNTGNSYAFAVDGSDALNIASEGNVGIGTSSPSTKLSTSSTIISDGSQSVGSNGLNWFGQNSNKYVAGIRNDSAGNGLLVQVGDDNAARKIIYAQNNSGDPVFVARGDGNVGIGTDSPTEQLEVAATAAIVKVRATGNNTPKLILDSDRANNVINSQILGQWNGTAIAGIRFNNGDDGVNKDNGAITLLTASAGSLVERMRILDNGNVGIGTNDPQAKLEIGSNVSNSFPSLYLSRAPDVNNISDIALSSNSVIRSEDSLRSVVNTGGYFSWLIGGTDNKAGTNGSTEFMRIDSSGRLLVGTIDPSPHNSEGISISAGTGVLVGVSNTHAAIFARHDSNGECVRFQRNNADVGSIDVTTTSTSYNESSDYRLKENVADIVDGIARLKQLQPRRFNFIADAETTVDGFIAHEAQAVVPQSVTGTKDEVDDDGNPVMQGIDQSKLVPLLTAALQEAIGEIETLKQRLTDAGIA